MSNSFAVLFYLKDKRLDKNGKAGLYLRLTVNGQRSVISCKKRA
ncbi:hypothetical protein LDL77_04350 [Flagellimonas marinaquae]|nr:hypothetical protein LDL77_04350 [Allomuricauda aquimarina]